MFLARSSLPPFIFVLVETRKQSVCTQGRGGFPQPSWVLSHEGGVGALPPVDAQLLPGKMNTEPVG